ncbi:MAG: S1 RNA-binding domain-containing protein [Conexivisphaerales archaeon]
MPGPILPDVGEVVLVSVVQLTPYGAYVTLDEYNGQKGFLHNSEVTTGWVRHIERFVKEDTKMVLKVIRIDRQRNEVDLSLRQVTSEEHKEKLIQVKREAKARGVLDIVKKELSLPSDADIRARLADEFGSLYDALEACMRKGPAILAKLGLDQKYVDSLMRVAAERFKVPSVVIKGVFELSSPRADGVSVIKDSLTKGMAGVPPDVRVEILCAGAPRYNLRLFAENFKVGERALAGLVDAVEAEVGSKAELKFVREKS